MARAPRVPTVGRLAAALAVAVAATLASGVIAAVTAGSSPGATRPAPAPRSSGAVTNVGTDGGQLAPLHRIVPPDLLAVTKIPIGRARAHRLARIPQVRDVLVLAAGAVQLQGRQVNAFAVEPAAFRSWTPPGTAKRSELWTALAGAQLVVSDQAARTLGLRPGWEYPVVGKNVENLRLGGAGPLGMPGFDVLVSRSTGERLGLVPEVAVLINAPGADPRRLAVAVRRVLGGSAQVLDLNAAENRASAGGSSYLDLYRKAAATCRGLSWTVLAAIGQIESDHGRNAGRSSAGALGPMQFMPATWQAYGVDGDGDGRADIMNPYDAVPSAARYLCATGAGAGGRQLYQAIWHYNHADWYVQKVLALARAYATRYR
ncbi:lytic transglycosylase domain-containing protein [Actinomadura craniellae]|uniref:lytic transglycosylase domain-containing protein n=1 Tax=Actinomadura craniellae TaxID=2231787 RepID=UPI001F477294|nr:lytic transglycosylase domain-containing protein [Actinomadura craniellae]